MQLHACRFRLTKKKNTEFVLQCSIFNFLTVFDIKITKSSRNLNLKRKVDISSWNSNKADDFTQVLHNDNSNVVLNELNTLIDNINTDSVTPDQVNGIVNDLGNVLLNAASSTFGQNQR